MSRKLGEEGITQLTTDAVWKSDLSGQRVRLKGYFSTPSKRVWLGEQNGSDGEGREEGLNRSCWLVIH